MPTMYISDSGDDKNDALRCCVVAVGEAPRRVVLPPSGASVGVTEVGGPIQLLRSRHSNQLMDVTVGRLCPCLDLV